MIVSVGDPDERVRSAAACQRCRYATHGPPTGRSRGPAKTGIPATTRRGGTCWRVSEALSLFAVCIVSMGSSDALGTERDQALCDQLGIIVLSAYPACLADRWVDFLRTEGPRRRRHTRSRPQWGAVVSRPNWLPLCLRPPGVGRVWYAVTGTGMPMMTGIRVFAGRRMNSQMSSLCGTWWPAHQGAG